MKSKIEGDDEICSDCEMSESGVCKKHLRERSSEILTKNKIEEEAMQLEQQILIDDFIKDLKKEIKGDKK